MIHIDRVCTRVKKIKIETKLERNLKRRQEGGEKESQHEDIEARRLDCPTLLRKLLKCE